MQFLGGMLVLIIFSYHSLASTTQMKIDQLENSQTTRISVNVENGQNSIDKELSQFSSYTQLSVTPIFKVNKKMKTIVSVSLLKDNTRQNKVTLSNTSLAFQPNQSLQLTPSIKMKPTFVAVLPTNYIDNRDSSFNGALALSTRFSSAANFFNIDSFLQYKVSMSRNFHTYSSNSYGSQNTKQALSHSFSMSGSLSKNIGVSVSASHSVGQTYNNSIRNAYSHSQSMYFTDINQITYTLGHYHGGSAYSYNGRDLDVKVFDPTQSQIFISVSKLF